MGYNDMHGREYSASTKRVLAGVYVEPSFNDLSQRSGSGSGSSGDGSLLTSNCTTNNSYHVIEPEIEEKKSRCCCIIF